MNWAVAASTGFGLGLVYFGALWLSVRALRSGARSPVRFLSERLGRLAVCAVAFYALLRTGGVPAVAVALVGLLAARWYLVRTVGRSSDGR